MKQSIFLNCTAHPLTDEQILAVEQLTGSSNHQDLKTLNPVLHENLLDCPPDPELVLELIYEFETFLLKMRKTF